jgi:hypothetical protein
MLVEELCKSWHVALAEQRPDLWGSLGKGKRKTKLERSSGVLCAGAVSVCRLIIDNADGFPAGAEGMLSM